MNSYLLVLIESCFILRIMFTEAVSFLFDFLILKPYKTPAHTISYQRTFGSVKLIRFFVVGRIKKKYFGGL